MAAFSSGIKFCTPRGWRPDLTECIVSRSGIHEMPNRVIVSHVFKVNRAAMNMSQLIGPACLWAPVRPGVRLVTIRPHVLT